MANEIDTAIYAKLSADSALTGLLGGTAIYADPAPEGTDPPYVVFSLQSEADEYTFAARAWENGVYQVKAITEGRSWAQAGTIAARIDAVLNDQPLAVTGRSHLVTRRISVVKYPETSQGQTWRHCGGLYRIIVS